MDSTHTTDIYSGATQELKEKAAKLRISTIVILCLTLFAIFVLILSFNVRSAFEKELKPLQGKTKIESLIKV